MEPFATLQILRGLIILRRASHAQIALFSGLPEESVAAYLATRIDIAEPTAPGFVAMRPEAREILGAEIAGFYSADPTLMERTDPGWDTRVREGVAALEGLLAEIEACPSAVPDLDYLALRLRAASKAVGKMRLYGKDVADEERRLAACGRMTAAMAMEP